MRGKFHEGTIVKAIDNGRNYIITFQLENFEKKWKFEKKKVFRGISMFNGFMKFMKEENLVYLITRKVNCYTKYGRIVAVGLIEENKFFVRQNVDGVVIKKEELY